MYRHHMDLYRVDKDNTPLGLTMSINFGDHTLLVGCDRSGDLNSVVQSIRCLGKLKAHTNDEREEVDRAFEELTCGQYLTIGASALIAGSCHCAYDKRRDVLTSHRNILQSSIKDFKLLYSAFVH